MKRILSLSHQGYNVQTMIALQCRRFKRNTNSLLFLHPQCAVISTTANTSTSTTGVRYKHNTSINGGGGVGGGGNDNDGSNSKTDGDTTTTTTTKSSMVEHHHHNGTEGGGGGGGGQQQQQQQRMTRSSRRRTTTTTTSSTGDQQQQRQQRRRLLESTENIPSYKEFVHRFTVLSLYRNFLKTIRDAMPHNQEDLKLQVRNEFRSHKILDDPYNVQRALAEGKRRYQELQEFTGANKKYDGDSWMNIKDPEDPRGRVGTGWPWQR